MKKEQCSKFSPIINQSRKYTISQKGHMLWRYRSMSLKIPLRQSPRPIVTRVSTHCTLGTCSI
ncbi:MAG: hypothetical protein LBL49_03065 [Clostridiales Family XIII bacterium]|nr:hypothetical protein [Clostridiales Family XIII bacterium]